MPLFYQHTISNSAKIGVWYIEESESFFLEKVPLPAQLVSHQHKKLQHLAGRYLLQALFPGFPYHLIEIADTRKPFLPNEAYHFSISHCGDYAAVIISETKRVGIDIEIPTKKIEKVQHKFLGKEETFYLTNNKLYQQSDDKMSALTLLWSCKEAVFKWYGAGGIDFKKHIRLEFEYSDNDSGGMQCRFTKNGTEELSLLYKKLNGLWLAWVI